MNYKFGSVFACALQQIRLVGLKESAAIALLQAKLLGKA